MFQRVSDDPLVDMIMYHTAYPFSNAWSDGAYDPVPYWISALWHDIPPVSVRRLAGVAGPLPQYHKLRVMRTKPQTETSRPGTYMNSVHAVYRLANGFPIHPPFSTPQNDCTHYSVRGEVTPADHVRFYDMDQQSSPVALAQAPYYVSPSIPQFLPKVNFALWNKWSKSGNTWSLSNSTVPSYFRTQSMITFFRFLSKGLSITGNIGGQAVNTTISNVEWSINERGNYSLEYDIRFVWSIFRTAYRHTIQYRHGLAAQPSAELPWTVAPTVASPSISGVSRIRSVMTELVWPVAGPPVPIVRDTSRTEILSVHSSFCVNSNPYIWTRRMPDVGVPRVIRGKEFPLEAVKIARGGICLAADDAISQIIPESSLFESLAEFRDIGGLISGSDFSSLLKEVSHVVGATVTHSSPWKVVIAALRAWSSATLLVNFSLKPTVDLLFKTDLQVGQSMSSLAALASGKPVRGRARLVYEHGGTEYEATCRSVMKFDMAQSVIGPLTLEYLTWGLTPASFWSTFPFAFAVDWFTKIGDSILRQQNTLMAYAMGITYCCNSVTLTTPIRVVDPSFVVEGVHRYYERVSGSSTPPISEYVSYWYREPHWLSTPLAFALKLAGA